MLRVGETAFLMDEHTNWLSDTKWSALKTYIGVTLCRLRGYIWGIYVYIHKHASYNGKKGHTFGKEEVEVHGSVCREEGGMETCCNYNLKNKIIKRLTRLTIT